MAPARVLWYTSRMDFEMESDVLQDVNKQFSLDALDNWATATSLVQSVIALIEQTFSGTTAHIFYHEAEFHEYREIDREGLLSIPDDSLFIGCLSMADDIMPLERLFADFQIDDPLLEQFLQLSYSGRFIVPVVHRFELLAFILLCAKADGAELTLSDADKRSLLQIADRVQVNLYAASVAERQQRQLLSLARYPAALQKHRTIEALYAHLLLDLESQLSFASGVCYAYEEETNLLIPFNSKGANSLPSPLAPGKGISGQAFERNNIIQVPDRATHPSYAAMQEEPFISGSFISVPFGSDKIPAGVITLSRDSKTPFGVEHRYLLQIAAAFIASEITNRQLFAKLDESNFNVVQSLARALEAKDAYTEGHSARVTKYALVIAKKLGYDAERLHKLRYGAMLHDIGKIGITDAIINKDGKLTDAEYTTIKAHTEIGYRILSNNPFFDDIKDFVRYHHETLTGSGYYKKKAGEYPEEAMIISCADIFDALTSDRPYRKALPIVVAIEELKQQVGVHYTQEAYDALKAYALSGDFSQSLEEEAIGASEGASGGDASK